ncbi:hypothetical protein SAMN05421858_1926 [Haladaptatus litoreus]|uniref:Uncharacterized protein n=1 Tax=Haladaptatus litoreus TaxID=553468 RepID=A0A1N6Z919_9EURY|nr:hypothetical protein [Haladaptatus litoreus]SIR23303.1 hypothetical protein SAMN05421858_1926 [Haladaptatus litoreus]
MSKHERQEPLLKLRAPISTGVWSDYAAPLALMTGVLLVLMFAVAGVEAVSVVAVFVGLCVGVLAAGLVAYNLLMVGVVWFDRR